MRVLYNATSARTGGGLTFARSQIEALADVDRVQLTVLASPWNVAAIEEAAGPGVEVRLVRVPNAAVRFAWEQVGLPWLARRHDVVISPGNFGALVSPVPQVVILQNANYVGTGRRMAHNAGWRRQGKIRLSLLSLRRADLVVSVSASLTEEIRSEPSLSGIEPVTVRSGLPDPPTSPSRTSSASVVGDLVGPEPFLLSVANDYPHKRLEDLADLAAALPAEGPAPGRIVLAGDISPERRDELRDRAGSRGDDLVFLGPVGDPQVVAGLYEAAVAAVVTSELESWGLTLHEAAASGCPVVATDLAAHREVAVPGATYVPVGDVTGLVEAVGAAAVGPRPAPGAPVHGWSTHVELLVDHLDRLVEPVAPADPPDPQVALFQPVLAHYRVPLFNAVRAAVGDGLTLFATPRTAHAGVADEPEGSLLTRRPSTTRRLGPLWCVPRTLPEVWSRRWDVVVLSWNVRQVELLPALVLARWRRVPVILWGQGLGGRGRGPAVALRRLQAGLAQGVLTYSERGREQVLALAPDQRVRTMLNTSARPAPEPGDHLGSVRRRVAFVGRLDPRKHVDRLVAALALLDEPVLALDVIGDGPERQALEREVDRRGLGGRVRWHGHLTDWDRVRTILAGCDLVVLPSHAGLAVVDAFAAARGVVVVDEPSANPPEADLVVDGRTGFRYGPPSAEGLARTLARAYADPEALLAVSEEAASVYRDELVVERAAAVFAALVEEVTAGDEGRRGGSRTPPRAPSPRRARGVRPRRPSGGPR